MKKVLILAVMACVLFAGCKSMNLTVAKSVVRLDKNCNSLFPNYQAVLGTNDNTSAEIDKEHEQALMEATLLLTGKLVELAQEEYPELFEEEKTDGE